MINDATILSGGASQTSTGSDSLSQLNEDYTRFLTLLTAQISNQDPLDPMDSTQFVTQLAQLSQVEQSIKTNDQLGLLGDQISAFNAVAGTNMVGREVTVSSDKIILEGGVTNTFYSLPEGAEKVVAQIRDPLDRVIRTIPGLSGKAGEQIELNWDGKDESGQSVLDGVYTISMEASDLEENQLDIFVYRRAQVSEVLFEEGEMFFDVGANEFAKSTAVLSVK